MPKTQGYSAGSGSSVPGSPACVISTGGSEGHGYLSSASNSSRTSSHQKKQTPFFGSPIRHSVNLVGSPSDQPQVSSPDLVSQDKRVRFSQASQVECSQVDPFTASSSKDTSGFTRKFTLFPNFSKPSSENPMRRNEN